MKLPLITFTTTCVLLVTITLLAPFSLLLATRLFGETAGYIEIFVISIYTAFMSKKMVLSHDRANWRRIIWISFSFLFFGQLILGLIGHTEFLQTGNLHYPVPALIIAGPIYRQEGFFMLGLYLTTLILSGPAWCSHLCYVGAVDNWLSKGMRLKENKKDILKHLRYLVLILSIILPLILLMLKLPMMVAHTLVIIFILITLISFAVSRKQKTSFYCSSICPIGIISTFLGRINPLRLTINNNCDLCGKCEKICKYKAIDRYEEKMRINYRCTLCMDCTTSCSHDSIKLSLLVPKKTIRDDFFYGLVLTLHGVFIACARI